MSEDSVLGDRRKALEESFFARRNRELLDKLKAEMADEETRSQLAAALGFQDPPLIDELMKTGIDAQALAALGMVPLVAVAWADGKLDVKERDAVRAGAAAEGIAAGSAAQLVLEHWLEERPDPALIDAWKRYVKALQDQLGPAQHRRLGEDLLGRARKVAHAAGGILGLGSISGDEQKVLEELKSVFH